VRGAGRDAEAATSDAANPPDDEDEEDDEGVDFEDDEEEEEPDEGAEEEDEELPAPAGAAAFPSPEAGTEEDGATGPDGTRGACEGIAAAGSGASKPRFDRTAFGVSSTSMTLVPQIEHTSAADFTTNVQSGVGQTYLVPIVAAPHQRAGAALGRRSSSTA
jgi:hypothetical protein